MQSGTVTYHICDGIPDTSGDGATGGDATAVIIDEWPGTAFSDSDFTQPSYGLVTLNAEGIVTYTPPYPDFDGTDSFNVTIHDQGVPSMVEVNLTVQSGTVTYTIGDGIPDASGDGATGGDATAVIIDEWQPYAVSDSDFTQPSYGLVTLTAEGTVTYTPPYPEIGRASCSESV